ncbi:MAG: VanW family protein [Paludibacteraceae bacterium]|nr:VanW family protein [Paludibacteraceae bacterium]
MNTPVEKPLQRSKLRRMLGKEFYIAKRFLKWHFSSVKYAQKRSEGTLKYAYIIHKSPLLRKLKDVDMQLQHNKVTNLRIAISHLDGILIRPNETFSIWRLVGRPTKRKGYLEGMMIHNGKVSTGTGGGLCQLGNLIYWMALHTPLDITERWRHSFDVFPDSNRTIPFACGATLAYNYIDLQLKNNTSTTFKINLHIDDEYLHGSITADCPPTEKYEIFETDHRFEFQPWGGYTRHNRIWKRITNLSTNETQEILVAENNAIMMYNPMLEYRQ